MIKKILEFFGFIEAEKKPKRGTRYDYVKDLILRAKRHELKLGNKPTKLTISPDLMEVLECSEYYFVGKDQDMFFGLKINVDWDSELHISVD